MFYSNLGIAIDSDMHVQLVICRVVFKEANLKM